MKHLVRGATYAYEIKLIRPILGLIWFMDVPIAEPVARPRRSAGGTELRPDN